MNTSININHDLFAVKRQQQLATEAPTSNYCFSPLPLLKTIARHRAIQLGEPLAFCDDCKEWTPMEWLPAKERDRKADSWFKCAFCGGRRLTFRILEKAIAIP